MLEPPARRQALRDAGDFRRFSAQHVGEVVRGGLALNIGAEREDDLHLPVAGIHSPHQLRDMQVFRGNAVERGKLPAEAMVAPLERAGALQRQHIGRLLNDAKQRVITLRIITDPTALAGGEKSAHRAWDDRFVGANERSGKHCWIGLLVLE